MQQALGVLRDHLDHHPRHHAARLLYGRWLVEHGSAIDWRAALVAELELVEQTLQVMRWQCTACGLIVSELLFVCPRCCQLSRFESLESGASQVSNFVVTGARLIDLIGGEGGDPDSVS